MSLLYSLVKSCTVCKTSYECKVRKIVKILSVNVVMFFLTCILIFELSFTICLGIQTEKPGLLVNASFSYVFFMLYLVVQLLYKYHTENYTWFAIKSVNTEYDVHTNEYFSVHVIMHSFYKRCHIEKGDLHIIISEY